jgi:hypothetical protein
MMDIIIIEEKTMNIYKDAFALFLSDLLVATFCVPDAEEAAAVDDEVSLTDVDG